MNFKIIYGPLFRNELREHLAYLREKHVSSEVIDQWYNRLFDLIDSLEQWPMRFPVDEAASETMERETRKIFGDYLVLYQVDDEKHRVDLIAFIHGATRKER